MPPSPQVTSLTAEVARLSGQQVVVDEAPGAAGDVLDASAVISSHLVSFRTLQELVAQNTQLRWGGGQAAHVAVVGLFLW